VVEPQAVHASDDVPAGRKHLPHNGRQVFGRFGCATESVANCPGPQGADLLGGIGRLVAGEHCLGGVGERFADGLAVVRRGVGLLGCSVVKGQGVPGDGGLLALQDTGRPVLKLHASPLRAASQRS
jgi:hypothetical protein